jgi:2-oxo-3-hexenedioate decarboxylase
MVLASAAETILDAFATHRLIAPLSAGDPSLDEARAYEIASEIHERRIRGGEQPVGRKIGFTNRSLWASYGVSAPVWGYVYDSTVHHAPGGQAQLACADLLQPRIEPEIQLHFARTPPVTRDEAAILGCIDWIAHGFELVQCPFPDWQFTAADAIAAFTLHGALVLGPPIAVSGIEDWAERLRSFTIALSKDGEQQASGGGASVLDSPLLAFAHLAELLAEQSRFAPVQAGEIVTTGTLTAPEPVAPGETWSTTLEGVDLPGLSITLA